MFLFDGKLTTGPHRCEYASAFTPHAIECESHQFVTQNAGTFLVVIPRGFGWNRDHALVRSSSAGSDSRSRSLRETCWVFWPSMVFYYFLSGANWPTTRRPLKRCPRLVRPKEGHLTRSRQAFGNCVSLPSTVLWLLFRCLHSRPVHVCEDSPAKTIRGLMHNILNLI